MTVIGFASTERRPGTRGWALRRCGGSSAAPAGPWGHWRCATRHHRR